MKKFPIFLKSLKPKKLAALILAFAVAVPSTSMILSAKAAAGENLSDIAANPGMMATSSADTAHAKDAFQYSGSWQNTNEQPVGEGQSQWLALDFGKPTTFQSMQIWQYGKRLKQFSIQISDDGQNWITVYQGVETCTPPAEESWNTPEEFLTVSMPEAVTANHFRLMMEEVTGNDPKVIIGQVLLFNNALTTTATVHSADLADVSLNSALKTAASVNEDTASGAFQYSGSWQTTNEKPVGGGQSQWVSVDFGKKTKFNSIRVQQYGRRLKQFSIQGSDDGTQWHTIFQGTDTSAVPAAEKWGEYFTVAFDTVEYSQFRLNLEEVTGNDPKVIIGQISVFNSPSQTSSSVIKPLSSAIRELAHGLPAEAYTASSCTGADQDAPKAFDEYDWSPWMAKGGAQEQEAQWLMVNLGEKKTFSRMDFSQYRNRAAEFKLQVSDDAAAWTDVFHGQVDSAADAGDNAVYTVVFPETSGVYFRILFQKTATAEGATIQSQPAVFDVKIYDKTGGAATSTQITEVIEKPDTNKELAHRLENDAYKGSTAQKDQEAPYAFDADPYSVWQAESTAQVTASQWLMVDFKTPQTMSRMDFIQYGNRARQFKLQVSDNAEDWSDAFKGHVADAADNGKRTEYTIVFPQVTGRYFRILFLDMAGKTEDNTVPSMPAVFDMKIYEKADGATTSAPIAEGLLDPEDSFNPPAPLNPIVKPENIALNKGEGAYTSSSNMKDQLPQYAFDGNYNNNWQNSTPAFPSWLQVDFGTKTDVTGLWVSQWSNRIKYFQVLASDDGEDWRVAFHGRITNAEELTGVTELHIAFPKVTTRFLRFAITDAVYDTVNKSYFTVPIYELEVYNSPDWKNGSNVVDVETEKPTEQTLKELNTILKRVGALDETQYTAKSFAALKKLYDDGLTYADGTKGNDTEVRNLIAALLQAEKELIPLSSYNDLREIRKQILRLDGSKYHPDDWNNLMLLAEYADILLEQEDADTSVVAFYVKALDIALASLRPVEEENLDYTYEINPQKADEYDSFADNTGHDSQDGNLVDTGESSFACLIAALCLLSISAGFLACHVLKKHKS